jgi:hypothetical protein
VNKPELPSVTEWLRLTETQRTIIAAHYQSEMMAYGAAQIPMLEWLFGMRETMP